MLARALACLGCWAVLASGAPPAAALGTTAPSPLPCTPENGSIVLDSQETLIALSASNCTSINGSLTIRGSEVRSLRPLAGLREVSGLLTASTTGLRSLHGLGALQAVGALDIEQNVELETLAGIENLRRIGQHPGQPRFSLRVAFNPKLRNLSGLCGLRGSLPDGLLMMSNQALESLEGLQGIGSVSKRLKVWGYSQLESLRPLDVLSEEEIELEISGNLYLRTLDGLERITRCSRVFVDGNDVLESLHGLRGLGGHIETLRIYSNGRLPSLRGLENVSSIGSLHVSGNGLLTSLRGLEGTSSLTSLRVSLNAALRSLAALGGVRGTLASVTVVGNPSLRSLHGLQGITDVSGELSPDRAGPGGYICIDVNSNSRLESVDALAGPLGGLGSYCFSRFKQNPLVSFPAVPANLSPPGNLFLKPAPLCFPNRTRKWFAKSIQPAPLGHWDKARCRECMTCGLLGGLPVPCDFYSGRCRCPLGTQGTDCASPVIRVRVVPGQSLSCAHPGGDVAIACAVQIALRREGVPGGALQHLQSPGADAFGVYAVSSGSMVLRADNGSSHEAVWANETHGTIAVSLWSGQGGDATLELRVGYLPEVQPAVLLEGTVPTPSPAVEDTLFPWCLDSESCALTAPEHIEVRQCPPGLVATDGVGCARCPVGQKFALGGCYWDWTLLLGMVGAFALALAGFLTLAAQVEIGGLCLLGIGLQSRRIPIQDVSRERGRVLLTVHGRHHLHSGLAKSFRVSLAETGHPGLDSPEEPLRARIVQPDQLELLDASGEQLRSGRFDSSQGFVRLPLGLIALHTGWPLPVAFSAPVLLAAASCPLVWLCGGLSGNDGDGRAAPLWWAACVVAAALAASALGLHLRGRRSSPTPLEKRRGAYDGRRSKGLPVRVERGVERAISAGQLVDLHDFFREFIRDRDMYYVVANLVMPLTANSRLSFAEYVGPSRLSWFASHFWGTGFQHFCDSVRRHAEAVGDWERQSYWICSFSINQRALQKEIGIDHRDSSFYLALHSGSCRGTCMVIDEQALPLTRSWCLFELLQTIELERKGAAGFEGLVFCTHSGVLNSGRASVETSMALGRRLATLKLEDADASLAADKAKIDGLVVNTMGGFDAMNRALRSRISVALRASKETAAREFELLEQALRAPRAGHCLPPWLPSVACLQAPP